MNTFKDIRFVVIDDYAGMRHLITSLLKSNGAGIISQYPNPKLALQHIENGMVDFIICDYSMPEITGLDLVKHIRNLKYLDRVAILMVTAESDRETILSFNNLKIDGYIVKPFSAQTLIDKVIKISENREFIPKGLIQYEPKVKPEIEEDIPIKTVNAGTNQRQTNIIHAEVDMIRSEAQRLKTLNDIRFVIADDYAGMRHLISTLLRNAGASDIHQAQNGRQAYTFFNTGHVDFLICDFNMPEMNGLELVKEIRSHQRFAHVAILMVTAEAEHDMVVSFAMLGVDGYIVKPFKAKDLIDKITEIAVRKHLITTSLLTSHQDDNKAKVTKIAGFDTVVEEFDI